MQGLETESLLPSHNEFSLPSDYVPQMYGDPEPSLFSAIILTSPVPESAGPTYVFLVPEAVGSVSVFTVSEPLPSRRPVSRVCLHNSHLSV